MKNSDITNWSLGSEGSSEDQNTKSFTVDLGNLCINSSLDSNNSADDKMVSRGKPKMQKSVSHPEHQIKTTSRYVLKLMQPCKSKSSASASSSSVSPTSEIHMSSLPCDQLSMSNSVSPVLENPPHINISSSHGQSTRKVLEKIIINRLFKKKTKVERFQWKFEFGDTNLIKCCRGNQVREVRDSIKELFDYNQYALINHKNAANETALSIATYQMNEVLINLLLENGASSLVELSMKNNVLHLAADLVADKERKTFSYLVNAIQRYQPEQLLQCLGAKNIFNYDPIAILEVHRNTHFNNHLAFNRFQILIDSVQALVNSYNRHFSLI